MLAESVKLISTVGDTVTVGSNVVDGDVDRVPLLRVLVTDRVASTVRDSECEYESVTESVAVISTVTDLVADLERESVIVEDLSFVSLESVSVSVSNDNVISAESERRDPETDWLFD